MFVVHRLRELRRVAERPPFLHLLFQNFQLGAGRPDKGRQLLCGLFVVYSFLDQTEKVYGLGPDEAGDRS